MWPHPKRTRVTRILDNWTEKKRCSISPVFCYKYCSKSPVLKPLHKESNWRWLQSTRCISWYIESIWQSMHQGLHNKLRQNSISGELLNTLTDFLNNRTQRIISNSQYSSWAKVEAEVPQGSILVTDSCRDGWNVRNYSASQVQNLWDRWYVQTSWWIKCTNLADLSRTLKMNTPVFGLSQL